MPIFTDSFPAPALDSARWTEFLQGAVSLSIGVPVDGVYPVDVDAINEEAAVHSRTKIYVPANHTFEAKIDYVDPYAEVLPPVTRNIYFGWRSIIEGGGSPLWGVDVILRVVPGPAYVFLKRVIENGVVTITALIPDPTFGATGKFKIRRSGFVYEIFYYNGAWSILDAISLGYIGLGYIRFGVYAESPPPIEESFPWILEP